MVILDLLVMTSMLLVHCPVVAILVLVNIPGGQRGRLVANLVLGKALFLEVGTDRLRRLLLANKLLLAHGCCQQALLQALAGLLETVKRLSRKLLGTVKTL